MRRRALLAASMPNGEDLINFEIAVNSNNNSFLTYQRPNIEGYTWEEWLDSPYNVDGYYAKQYSIPEMDIIGFGITLNGRDFISTSPNNKFLIIGRNAFLMFEKYYLTTV